VFLVGVKSWNADDPVLGGEQSASSAVRTSLQNVWMSQHHYRQTVRLSLKFFSQRHKCFWWVSKVELQTVRPLGADSPLAQTSELHYRRFEFPCSYMRTVRPGGADGQPATDRFNQRHFLLWVFGVFFSTSCFYMFECTFKLPYQIHSTQLKFDASTKNIPLFHAIFVQIQFVSILYL